MITVSCESKDHADFNNNALNVEEKYRSIGSSPLGGGGVPSAFFSGGGWTTQQSS